MAPRATTTSKESTGIDVLCKRCGKSWRDIPDETAPALLTAHLKRCPVPVSAEELVTAISAGTYDNAIEALLCALHNRKRYRRGDIFGSLLHHSN